jgi:hypothetical protein
MNTVAEIIQTTLHCRGYFVTDFAAMILARGIDVSNKNACINAIEKRLKYYPTKQSFHCRYGVSNAN